MEKPYLGYFYDSKNNCEFLAECNITPVYDSWLTKMTRKNSFPMVILSEKLIFISRAALDNWHSPAPVIHFFSGFQTKGKRNKEL